MKNLLLVVLILFSNLIYSQVFKVENINGEKVINARFYSEKYNLFSDNNGKINLSKFERKEIITAEHLSYKTLKFMKSDFENGKIILYPRNFIIEEISIHSNLNVETNKTQIIKLKQNEILESLSSNTSEILEKSSSITIQKSQSGGGSPNIRGFEANRILLVIDGVKLNNTIYRSGHLQNILSIDPYIIEDISVLHGPSSIFYGSGALGGAIVINTIHPEKYSENKSLFVQQFESASNSVLGHFHSIYKLKNLSFLSSISLKKYGNIRMGGNRFHSYENWGKDVFTNNGNEQLYGEYNQIDLNQKIHVRLQKNEISFNSQFSTTNNINRYDKLNDISNGMPKYSDWYYGPQNRFLQSFEFQNNNATTTLYDNYLLTISYQNIEESRHKKKFSETFFTRRYEKLNILDLKLNFSKKTNHISFNYGLESRYQKLNSEGFTQIGNIGEKTATFSRYPDGGSSVSDYSVFTQIEYNLSSKSKLYSGVRYDLNNLKYTFSDNSLFESIPRNNKLTNHNLSFSSNYTYNINEQNFIGFSIFSGFRNPNIDDVGKIFSKNDNYVVVPNINLQSEKILSGEIIVRTSLFEKTDFEISGYYSYLSNAIEKRKFILNDSDSIVYDGEMMMTIANVNIKNACLSGFNFLLNHQISNRIHLSLQSSFVKSLCADSLPLAHIPPLSVKSQIKYKFSEKSTFKLYSYYNSWKNSNDFDINGVDNLEEATIDGTPMWFTLNISFYHKINNNLKMSIALENILDSHYKTFASGISAKGRNLIINLQTVL